MAFVLDRKQAYLPLRQRRLNVWQAIAALSEFVDDSDPDLETPQLDHALQTSEALRAAGKPDWLILTGFVHDLGKLLACFGEPQWAVVGDTFPVGCAFSERIVLPELFAENPDMRNPDYGSKTGIYAEGCGLDAVHLSWGHDEYLYQVLRDHLAEEALYVIRYHSFYAAHRERAYDFLMDARDHRLMENVRDFNRCDLYSKSEDRPDFQELRPYYEDLVARFLPAELQW